MLGVALALGAAWTSTPAEADDPVETTSRWELDGDVQDTIGDRHGEALPGVELTEAGAVFDGANDAEIQLPYDRALEPGNRIWELTLEDVVPGPLTNQHQAIATSRSTNNQGWAVYIMPNGELRLWVRVVGQGQWAQYATGVTAVPGSSYDLAITRAAQSVRIQISGAATADVTLDMGVPIVNNGSNPIRLGNGGDQGTEFFYRGSIGAVALSTTEPAEPWATCSATASAVAPPDPALLSAAIPQDDLTQLSLEAAQNANRFITTTWWEDRFAVEDTERIDLAGRVANTEYALRGVAMAAVSTAMLLATGAYDPADTGVSEAEARERVVRLVSSAAAEHRGNDAGGWGPEDRQWQASLWAYYNGFAAWLLWDDFSPAQQACVASMVALEADVMPEPGYYQAPNGTILSPGDTKAEENAWQSSLSGLAALMMPGAENAAQWRDDAIDLSIAAWATPSDTGSSERVNGRVLTEFLGGSNVEDDGTVANHDLMHPIYMLAFDQNINNALAQQLAGELPATAFLHNVDLTYGALVDLPFESPPWRQPGGTIYVPGQADIYYPDGNDWGTTFPLYFAQADVIADSFGLGDDLSAPPEEWGRLHLEAAIALQDRFPDGRTYANNTESNYGLKEERTAQIAAHTFLTRFLNAAPPECLTDRPYTTTTADVVLGELELAEAALAGSELPESVEADVRDALTRIADERADGGDGGTALRELQLLLAGTPASAAVEEIRRSAAAADCVLQLPAALSAPSEAEPGSTIELGLTGAESDTEYAIDLVTGDDADSVVEIAAAAALADVAVGAVETGTDGVGLATVTLPADLEAGPVTIRATSGDTVVDAVVDIVLAAPDPTDPAEPDPDPSTDPGDDPGTTDGTDAATTAPTAPGSGSDGAGGGSMPVTGLTGVGVLALLAALAAGAGAVLLVARRRWARR